MTLNREMLPVTVITYKEEYDSYGQPRTIVSKETTVEMAIKLSSQMNISNPEYVEVEAIGLTKDKTITDANSIIYNGETYNIKKVIPSGRFLQLLLIKAK